MVLFCLPFICVGLGAIAWLAWDLAAWQSMRSWVETPAIITHAELHTHRGDTTTYSVSARYTYQYGGRQYTGDRVDIDGSTDNVGDYHQRLFKALDRARERGAPYPVYVNPQSPSEAVINRDLRGAMLAVKALFGFVFGAAGFGLLGMSIYGARRMNTVAARAAAMPDQPWLHEPEFADGVIAGEGARGLWGPWVFAVFWNAISMPAVGLAYMDGVFGKDPLALAMLLFPAVGLIILGTAIYATAQFLKYGRSEFRPAKLPGVLGGALRGVIHVPRDLDPPDGFHLEISCIHRKTSGTGKNRRTHERVLWQDTRSISLPARRDHHGTDIPVLFALPHDGQPTDTRDANDERVWQLSARAAMPGIDYSERFRVPVFHTGESREDFVLDESVLAPFLSVDQIDRDFATARVHVVERPDGVEFRLPAPRHAGMAIMATVFGLLFGGLGSAIGMASDAPRLFVFAFGGIGILMLWWAVALWSSAWRVHARRGALTVQGGPFALGRLRTVQAGEIQSIDASSNTAVGNQQLYNVILTNSAGKKIPLAKWLPNQRIAQQMIDRIIAGL